MSVIPSDLDYPAETDEEIFEECAERLRIAEEIESNNRMLAIEDIEFADGQQWPDDIYNMRKIQRRPSLTINMTATLVRRVINNMKEQRPRIKVHPVGDGVDIEDARVANGIIRHIEYRSQAQVAYDMMGESAVRAGWGYLRVLSEYVSHKHFEQELCIVPVRNVFTGYIDPDAVLPDGSDMKWFIFSEKMSRRDFKRLYPNEDISNWMLGAGGDNQRQWNGKWEVRLAEYYRIKETRDTLYELTNGKTMLASEYRKNQDAFRHAQILVARDPMGQEIMRPSVRRRVEWYRLNGSNVVDRRKLPGRWIPVVRCEGNVLDLNGEVRRKGMIRDLKDPARMFNYWETQKTEKLALSAKAPWIMAEGQADGHPEWEDANQKPYSTLQYKVLTGMDGNPLPNVPPPIRMPAIEVEAGFVEASQTAAKNLLAVAGMPHDPVQDAPGQVVSGVALRKRQAMSDISHFQYYDNQTMAIAQVGRILLDLIPAYYSEPRMQRIIGEDGVPEMIGINQKQESQPGSGIFEIKHDMSVGQYDVVMDTGPGYESKRQEAAESLIELLKTPLAEPIIKTGSDLIVRNLDFPGAEDLADRLAPLTSQGLEQTIKQLPKQAQGIVTALNQQLQQANQVIQQQALEIKYKGGIEHMRQSGEIERTHIEAATKVHDTDTRARTELDKAHIQAQAGLAETEIDAGAKIIHEHVKGKYAGDAAKLERSAAQAEKANGGGK